MTGAHWLHCSQGGRSGETDCSRSSGCAVGCSGRRQRGVGLGRAQAQAGAGTDVDFATVTRGRAADDLLRIVVVLRGGWGTGRLRIRRVGVVVLRHRQRPVVGCRVVPDQPVLARRSTRVDGSSPTTALAGAGPTQPSTSAPPRPQPEPRSAGRWPCERVRSSGGLIRRCSCERARKTSRGHRRTGPRALPGAARGDGAGRRVTNQSEIDGVLV